MLIPAPRKLPLAAALVAAALGPAAPRARAADCNRNGVEDQVDVASGSVPDCDANGIPDACDISPVNFALASRGSLFVEPGPAASAAADLDADGDIDLAVACAGVATRLPPGPGAAGSVAILWNGGTGSFLATTRHPAAVEAPTIQAGDIDGDGRIDIAAAAAGEITILLNRGLRRFGPVTVGLGPDARPRAIVLADLDGDADLDIAAAGFFEAIVLENDGGTFTGAPDAIPIGSNPVAIAAARIDGDDALDLVTANALSAPVPSGNVSVLLNEGDGTFRAPRNFGVGAGPASIAAGDLDGDGRTDVLTANAASSDLSLLPGRGDGTFAEPRRIEAGGPPAFAALADLDLDGDLDPVYARERGGEGAVCLAFNHRGALTKAVEFPVRFPPVQLSLQDLTGDGRLEIAIPEPPASSVLILEGTLMAYDTDCDANGVPDGCELEAADCNGNGLPDGCDISSGESRDCDRDGMPDECQPDCNRNGAHDACDIDSGTSHDCNLNGVPDECDVRSTALSFDTFTIPYEGEPLLSLRTADLDADGRPDVHGARFGSGISVLWNGRAGFGNPPSPVLTGVAVQAVDAGDLDGDGDLDLAAGDLPGTRVLVLVHDGNRSFTVRDRIPVGKVPSALAAGDLDADGDIDVVVLEAESGLIRGLENGGNGALEPGEAIGQGVGQPIQLADIDRDGMPDIIALDAARGAPAVFWNEGGRFPDRTALGGQLIAGRAAVADLDGDEDLDVAGNHFDGFTISLQEGRRSFRTQEHFPAPPGFIDLAAADFDRDGDTDLASGLLKEFLGGVGLLLNRGDASFEDVLFLGEGGFVPAITSGDHDGDGAPDLVASMIPLCDAAAGCEDTLARMLVLGNLTSSAASQDANQNGRPDECDPGAFRRGDSDGSGALDLADAVFTLRALFQGGPATGCAEAADADNDGSVNVTDPVSVLDFLFRGGPPPAAPGPPPGPCGLDTDAPGSPGDLGCAAYTSC